MGSKSVLWLLVDGIPSQQTSEEGGENVRGSSVCIIETPPVSSFAPQHAIRGGEIPTAALGMPPPSSMPIHTGRAPARASVIPTAASIRIEGSVYEATLAGGGVTLYRHPHLPWLRSCLLEVLR